jgi:hypothetical protein
MLVVPQLVKIISALYGTRNSLMRSQDPATDPYSEPAYSGPRSHIRLIKFHLNTISNLRLLQHWKIRKWFGVEINSKISQDEQAERRMTYILGHVSVEYWQSNSAYFLQA